MKNVNDRASHLEPDLERGGDQQGDVDEGGRRRREGGQHPHLPVPHQVALP